VKLKTGNEACPFNSLYWDFLHRNVDKLGGNARLGNVYRTWARISPEKQKSYLQSAEDFLENL
jgi:deoxyribodipyrimidine photolyase-related protein